MIFKKHTKEEIAAFDALITQRYNDLFDHTEELIRHMMEAYKVSQSDEDMELLERAIETHQLAIEDACRHEYGKKDDPIRGLRGEFLAILDAADDRAKADRQAKEIQSTALAVQRIDETLSALRQQSHRVRRGFSPQVKALLVKATEAMGGNCPCCGKQPVVKGGERASGAEFDHFFANHVARADAGWLICQKCHRGMNHDAGLRTEKISAFAAFQEHRRAAEKQPQIDIGLGA